jgi:hypothetical protein
MLRALFLGMALLLIGGLAACTPTSSPASAPTPTAPPQQCGSVSIGAGQQIVTDNAGQAENCFWQAFKHCQPATLTVTMIGVDSGIIRTFTIKPTGSTCTIIDQAQTFQAPNHKGPLQTYTCAGLVQQQGGLLFQSCGADGNVAVPPPTN